MVRGPSQSFPHVKLRSAIEPDRNLLRGALGNALLLCHPRLILATLRHLCVRIVLLVLEIITAMITAPVKYQPAFG